VVGQPGPTCLLDTLSFLLGALERPRATLAVQRRQVRLRDSEETINVTAHDQVCVSGRLASGAVAALHYRAAVQCGTHFHWEINGSWGDILVRAPTCSLAGSASKAPRLARKASPGWNVPEAYWPLAGERSGLAYNVALVYERIAGDLTTGSRSVPTIADAVKLHRALEAIERDG
jgi:predicted dehydrogenase